MYGNATERIENQRRERKQMEKESSPFTAQMGTCLWKGVFLNKKSRRKTLGKSKAKGAKFFSLPFETLIWRRFLGIHRFVSNFRNKLQLCYLYWSVPAALTKYHRLGGFKNRSLFPLNPGGWQFKIKMPANLIYNENSLSGCRWPPSHTSLYVNERERKRESWSCSPNIVHEGEGFNIWILGGCNQSTSLLKNSVFLKLPYHTLDL